MEKEILEKAQDIKQDYVWLRYMLELSQEEFMSYHRMNEVYEEYDWENQLKEMAEKYNIEYDEDNEEIVEYGIIPYLEFELLNYLGDIIDDCINEMLMRFPNNELLKQ